VLCLDKCGRIPRHPFLGAGADPSVERAKQGVDGVMAQITSRERGGSSRVTATTIVPKCPESSSSSSASL